jgi:hypothetical protein
LVLHSKPARDDQMIGDIGSQNFQCSLHSRTRGYRSSRTSAKVRVIEIGKSICGGTHLTSHSTLFPGHHAIVGTQFSQHGANGIAIANHYPVNTANFPRLSRDT